MLHGMVCCVRKFSALEQHEKSYVGCWEELVAEAQRTAATLSLTNKTFSSLLEP